MISTEEYAQTLILPKIELKAVTILQALDYLRETAKAADQNSDGMGPSIIFKPWPEIPLRTKPDPYGPMMCAPEGYEVHPQGPVAGESRITLALKNVPLSEALKHLANLTIHALRWDEHAIVLTDIGKDRKPIPKPEIRYEQGPARELIARKLAEIVIPKIVFGRATIREAVEFLSHRVKALVW